MSGPVATDDAAPVPGAAGPGRGPGRRDRPGPRRPRWAPCPCAGSCPSGRAAPSGPGASLDHVGPVRAEPGVSFGIGPHPHMGLQTVTWLLAGELLHLDSLGSEQLIRPGQLNLMTAGHGVSHAEEDPARAEEVHAVQLWVAQPAGDPGRSGRLRASRRAASPRARPRRGDGPRRRLRRGGLAGAARHRAHGRRAHAAGPEHRRCRSAPTTSTRWWSWRAGSRSTASRWSPACWPTSGWAGTSAGSRRRTPARALLLGGVPFPEPILMWWNFVGRSREEVSEARRQWSADDGRFGRVRSSLAAIEVGRPPWE